MSSLKGLIKALYKLRRSYILVISGPNQIESRRDDTNKSLGVVFS